MRAIRGAVMQTVSALALAGLLTAPVAATVSQSNRGRIVHKHSVRAHMLDADEMIGSFTPAAADPKLSGAFGRLGQGASGFRFTPSLAPGSRRAVTVAVRARGTTRAQAVHIASIAATAPTVGIAPSSYSLGAAIGWKRLRLPAITAGMRPACCPADARWPMSRSATAAVRGAPGSRSSANARPIRRA
jgi:hypothetical protein